MEPNKAAATLIDAIKTPQGQFTIADAAAKSGLALRDAQQGLHFLVSEYRGHLSATQNGDLLFSFPTGFSKPWEKIETVQRVWNRFKKAALGVAKFVVRAWISIVMVAYVAIFALILIALSFAKSSDREERSSFGGTLLFHTLFRVVLDSLFWTFHPFSPFAVGYDPYYRAQRPRQAPFYERVNRFFFGPEKPAPDPLENTRQILAQIRANRGRIGLSDVLKVTGLPKESADPLMSKLMLDYDGEVTVSEDGGLVYLFPEVRKTLDKQDLPEPSPIWTRREKLLPLTGNTFGSNFMIAGLNGFNFMMGFVAISSGWTVEKLQYMFTAASYHARYGVWPRLPADGAPLVLGWIPFIFSAALFALPVMRTLARGREKTRVANENGRRELLRAILTNINKKGIPEKTLFDAFAKGAGMQPSERAVVREIVKLGGDIVVTDEGQTFYQFADLHAESLAVSQERQQAKDSEKDVGGIVFSS